MHEPIFFSDGDVDEIRLDVRHQVEPLPPRVPRDRVLTTGGMWWLVITSGLFVGGAGYLVWEWCHS